MQSLLLELKSVSLTSLMIGIAYHVVALGFVFNFLKKILTADIWQGLNKLFTPKFLTVYYAKKEKIRRLHEVEQKKKANQEAREHARKYEDTYFSISFILQDRAELFAGYEDINWEYGNSKLTTRKDLPPRTLRIWQPWRIPFWPVRITLETFQC